jgi:excisionase family DNA binding protein
MEATIEDVQPDLLSVAVAAKRLGISESFARELIRQGTFPAVVVPLGKRKLVSRASLDNNFAAIALQSASAGDGADGAASGA